MSVDVKCFRCGARPKILSDVEIDGTTIKLCPRCAFELCLFLEGRAIDMMVCVEGDHYVRKEDKE